MKEINLEMILKNHVWEAQLRNEPLLKERVLQAMKEACNQTIELCAENATIEGCVAQKWDELSIDKQSILNTKNQII
jgi:hypothetical protein